MARFIKTIYHEYRADKKGLTLTELLVASILIGIVMIGIASFSVSVERLQNSTNKASILAMRTTAVMNQLTRDAYLATGDENDRGVITGGAGKKESICFRHDTDITPEDYTDDDWACYFIDNQRRLWLCSTGLTPPINNWGACKAGDGNEREILGLENLIFFNVVNDTGFGQLQYIDFTITALYDRKIAWDPIKNPRYTLSSQVTPPGHSSEF